MNKLTKKINIRFLIGILINIVLLNYAFAIQHLPPIDVDQLKSGERVLRIGRIADFPPFFYVKSSTHLTGIDQEVLQEIIKRVGIKEVKYVDYKNFTELNQALQSGNIDLIVSDYWDTPDHRKIALMTMPYYVRDGIAFVYPKNKFNFKSVADLYGHRIGVFTEETDILKWIDKDPALKKNLIKYKSREDMMNAFESNQIDAAFVYYILYSYLFGQQSKYSTYNVTKVEFINSVMGMRKQDVGLNNVLNTAIQSMWDDGTLYQINKKYLPQ